mgnify:CR=1 FL=1
MVTIETNLGSIKLELDPQKAPVTCANFLKYCQSGFFEGTIFHRVIKGFMIQGGGLTADMENKKGAYAPIENEANNGLKNDKYTIAMARTSDPHSATATVLLLQPTTNHQGHSVLFYLRVSVMHHSYAMFFRLRQRGIKCTQICACIYSRVVLMKSCIPGLRFEVIFPVLSLFFP